MILYLYQTLKPTVLERNEERNFEARTRLRIDYNCVIVDDAGRQSSFDVAVAPSNIRHPMHTLLGNLFIMPAF